MITGRARVCIPITSNTLRPPSGIGRRKPAAGNGIFGCRDGELKIGLRDCKCLQRPKKPNQAVEYPRRNGLFPIEDGFDGFGRLDGGVRSQIRTGLRPKIPC